jgi:Zn-dependent protease with chaperone function
MSMPSDTAVYEGRLSDGRTAASVRVEVRMAERGLQILPAGEPGTPALWPYAKLRSSLPVRADAPDVLLSLKPGGAETLFVAEPAFIRSLRARAGHLSPGRQRLLGLRTGAVFGALAAAVVGAIWYFDYQPLQTAARLMPQDMRERMGRNVIASLTGSMRECHTVPGRAALDGLTRRLTAKASDPPMQVRVIMVDWALVNAFAVPGGQLVLTKGLVQTAASADEVAGVLAHEMGHAIELHPETGLIRAVALGMAGDLVLAGSNTTGNAVLLLTQLRYSRAAEREADAHAVRILRNAGISPKGFGDFFERIDPFLRVANEAKQKRDKDRKRDEDLAALGRKLERTLAIVSTHPVTEDRLKMVRSQPDYPATPALDDAEWRALREMCGPVVRTAPPGPSPTPAPGPSRDPRPYQGPGQYQGPRPYQGPGPNQRPGQGQQGQPQGGNR